MGESEPRPISFGLVGTGYWAREVHAAGLAGHPDARLVGVWGRDPVKASALARVHGARAYADVDALVRAVEAVAFSVPPDVQGALAARVASAGRHLLLEKPLALGRPDADRMVSAVQSAGVASVVFFTERFLPEREAWLDKIRAQDGVTAAEATWLGSLKTPGNPFARSPWRGQYGALWDVGPHALSVVLPVLGPVTEVAARRGAEDTVHLELDHLGGGASTLHLSLTMPPDQARFGLRFRRPDGWVSRPETAHRPIDAYRDAVAELVGMARTGQRRHRCDAVFGAEVVEVLERAQRRLG